MKKIFILLLFCPFIFFAKGGYVEPWGKDSNIKPYFQNKNTAEKKALSIISKVANSVIVFHQKVLSPADGPRSSFRPTSSRYMQLAIQRYGFFKGYVMGCDRLLRENSEKWFYKTITIDGNTYKFDPAKIDKNKIL